MGISEACYWNIFCKPSKIIEGETQLPRSLKIHFLPSYSGWHPQVQLCATKIEPWHMAERLKIKVSLGSTQLIKRSYHSLNIQQHAQEIGEAVSNLELMVFKIKGAHLVNYSVPLCMGEISLLKALEVQPAPARKVYGSWTDGIQPNSIQAGHRF